MKKELKKQSELVKGTRKITKDDIKDIEKYACLGLWEKDIANMLGYNPNYFSECVKKLPEVAEALKKGRSKMKADLLNKIRKAGDGQWQANSWLLERICPDDFALKVKQEHSSNEEKPLKVEVVINESRK